MAITKKLVSLVLNESFGEKKRGRPLGKYLVTYGVSHDESDPRVIRLGHFDDKKEAQKFLHATAKHKMAAYEDTIDNPGKVNVQFVGKKPRGPRVEAPVEAPKAKAKAKPKKRAVKAVAVAMRSKPAPKAKAKTRGVGKKTPRVETISQGFSVYE